MISNEFVQSNECEAGERVAWEGSVVRDMKGAVIPHPAIAIEAAAQKLAAGLLKDWSR